MVLTTDIDRLQRWVPVRLLTFLVGTMVRLQNYQSKFHGPSAAAVSNMVEICSHPIPLFAQFDDREQMIRVVSNFNHPVQVPEVPKGRTLPKTLCAGVLGIPTSELIFALLRQGIEHVFVSLLWTEIKQSFRHLASCRANIRSPC